MKIGIDISAVVYGTGVSVYTKELVTNLLKIDQDNEYLLFGMSLRRQKEIKDFIDSFRMVKNISFKSFSIPLSLADFLWNKLHILSVENFIGKADVFHSSDWTQPPSRAFKVTTIHDLSPFKYPEFTPHKIVEVHTRRLFWIKKEVDLIIVPSRSTMQSAVSLGIKKEKIRIVPEANPSHFKKADKSEVDKVKKIFGADKYLLAVGTNPRKNTKRIIDAFKKLNLRKTKLIVVGNKTSYLPTPKDVIYLGFVSEQKMPAIYTGAQALIYPSLDEGFGLPILHAFACKTPVVTSNVSSMPEVAGSAAVLVDPKNVDAIAEGIKHALKFKDKLIAKGFKRVKDFSWEKTASQTLSIYQEALL